MYGYGQQAAYCASKGALIPLAKSLALAWAPDGINVNVVLPGAINTPFTQVPGWPCMHQQLPCLPYLNPTLLLVCLLNSACRHTAVICHMRAFELGMHALLCCDMLCCLCHCTGCAEQPREGGLHEGAYPTGAARGAGGRGWCVDRFALCRLQYRTAPMQLLSVAALP
jgi:hypothetical protein